MSFQFDPVIQKQVEEFHRNLEASQANWQQAALNISADRILQDLQALNTPPPASQGLAGQAKAAASSIWHRFSRKETRGGQGQDEGATVFQVDEKTSVIMAGDPPRPAKERS